MSAIGIEDVDRYRRFKVAERDQLRADREAEQAKPQGERQRLPRPLSDSSINKTIRLLASILEQAVEYGHLPRNPAAGRKRLLRERQPDRSFLEPAQTVALLDAAAVLDSRREGDVGRRRPLLAVMALGGLRIGEALGLRWRDVSLASQRLAVGGTKTDSARRTVALSPMLAEALTEYRARARYLEPDDLLFPTSTGRRDGESNVRRRILAPAVALANDRRDADLAPIDHRTTPHSLRRTFASLLLFANVDLRRVMAEIGHSDPKMTLSVYAQVVSIEPDRQLLEVLVGRGYRAEPGRIENVGASGAAVQPVP